MPRLAASGLATAATLLAGVACAQSDSPVDQGPPNVPAFRPAFPEQTRAPALDSGIELTVETIAAPLEHPWGIALLPDGGYLVTERPGRLRVVAADGTISAPVAGLPEVRAEGQGGLLDIALSPGFAQDRTVYWSYAKPLGGGASATAAARGRLAEDGASLTGVEDIFVQDPPSPTAVHYGSRIVPDGAGHLLVTTGEHFTERERRLAQDLATTYGKIVRIDADGTPPDDNPFAGLTGALPTIWSYGHRNVQAAALDAAGQLWTIEHGPQGGDELNRIEPGRNYGWPIISYGQNYDGSPVGEGVTARDGMEQPRYYWDPVIAPSGMVFYDGAMFPEWQGDLLVGSLSPGALVRLRLDGDKVVGEERLLTDAGRIRDVAVAPDGAVLVLTDADDGALLRLSNDAPPE
ncbi:PQQ-dependent sugar dehydrogenase [Amaricoccus sp.]|uniref:PQQ-dependent sugar dehydrogenase n=1 Tax=Amaricoccus sp. TaxID=1872485 RepID=UPI002624D64D|nr:PQQ-dependent sugar dehydrogenase [Amaricoccus sp.]HRO11675.1 PQQ-dependent sugar dehydrogenase [Amaricoccus sp.]